MSDPSPGKAARRIRVLRAVFFSAAYLLGGAAATAAVATGFALWGTLEDSGSVSIQIGADEHQAYGADVVNCPPGARALLARSVPSDAGVLGHQVLFRGIGLRDTWIIGSFIAPAAMGDVHIILHESGWPLTAMGCSLRSERILEGREWREAERWSGAWEAPDGMTRTAYEDLGYGMGDRPPVPLRPLPLGFAADTLFYAASLWAVLGGPRRIRRSLRKRRGQCPACGYPVGDAEVCSECGGAVMPRAAPAPHAPAG